MRLRHHQKKRTARRNRIPLPLKLHTAEPVERILPDQKRVVAAPPPVPRVLRAAHKLMAAVQQHRMQPLRPLREKRIVRLKANHSVPFQLRHFAPPFSLNLPQPGEKATFSPKIRAQNYHSYPYFSHLLLSKTEYCK